MSTREVGEFTQQLSTLLGAGLPLDRSLGVLLDLADSERVKRSVADIRDRVRGGGTLSEALEAQHGAFGRLYVNMVRAGEIGGVAGRDPGPAGRLPGALARPQRCSGFGADLPGAADCAGRPVR